MTIEAKKIQLTQRLLRLENLKVLNEVEQLLNKLESHNWLVNYVEIPSRTNIQTLVAEQQYNPMGLPKVMQNWDFDFWAKDPLDELLSEL